MSIAGTRYRFVKCGNCGGISTLDQHADSRGSDSALLSMNMVSCPHCKALSRAQITNDVSFSRIDIASSDFIEGVWCFNCNHFNDGAASTCLHCKSDYVRTAYRSKNEHSGLRIVGLVAAGIACAAFAPIVLPVMGIAKFFSKKK
jgi:hypothetical protein